MSNFLRTIVEVKLDGVDQMTYSEFIMSLPNPTCFNLLSNEPLEGNMILEMNPSIVFPIIEWQTGGGKTPVAFPERPLTEIEWGLTSKVVEKAISQLDVMWSGIKQLKLEVIAREANPQLMQIVAPNEPVVLARFEVILGTYSGMMNICVPFMSIEPIMPLVTSHTWFGYAKKETVQSHGISERGNLGNAMLNVVCYVAETTISLKDLLILEPGDLIELEKPQNSPLTICVEGKPKYTGVPGMYKRHTAVRVLDAIPAADKANAL
jgi:flagellar motor switch protein FliM